MRSYKVTMTYSLLHKNLLVIALVASSLPQSPIVYIDDSILAANTYKLLTATAAFFFL